MHNIVLVDDHQLVSEGFKKIIDSQSGFAVVAVYNDPLEALKKIPIISPDIVITDIDMPGIDGLQLIQSLKKANEQLQYIVISMHMDQSLLQQCKKLKVNGFLSKNTDEFELTQCLTSVSQRRDFYSQKALEMAISNVDSISTSASGKKTHLLTERELEILTLIASGKSTKDIAEELFIAVRTVETHRKNIMEKMEVNNMAGMVRIAVQEGLLD
ncbi:MAG: response regulator [Ekhidna sp.]